MNDKNLQRAAKKWDDYFEKTAERSIWVWYDSPAVYAALGEWSADKPASGPGELAANAIKAHFPGYASFKRAVSVGCGLAKKELYLLENGLVEHFTLYDIAPRTLESAEKAARKAGFGDAVTCVCADALELERGKFDLIYWDNSLHHMQNSLAALAWSKACLEKGGLLFINDYVGPNRFQFSDEMMELANAATEPLQIRRTIRPDPSVVERDDPTEAQDSAAIGPAVSRLFPGACVIPMGGAVYFLALTGRPFAIDEDVVPDIMAMDKLLNDHGQYLYAIYMYKND